MTQDLSSEELDRLAQQATALLQQDNHAAAEAAAQQVLAQRPDDAGLYHILSIALDRQGRTAEAAAAALRVAALVPDRPSAYSWGATLLMRAGDPGQAEALLRRGLLACAPAASLHDALSQALEQQGQFDAAIAAAQQAVALDPKNPHLHAWLGQVLLLRVRRSAEAEAAFRRALALRPDLLGCHDSLGLALEWQERWTESAAAIEAAIALDPHNPDRYLRACQLLLRGYAFALAAALAQQGIARHPQVLALRDLHVLALQSLGRTAEAIDVLSAAIALDPAHAERHLRLGYLLVRADDLDAAAAAFQRAAALDPGSAEARERLAGVIAARQACGQPQGQYVPGSRPLYVLLVVAAVGLGHLFVSILNSAYYAHRTGRRLALDLRRFPYAKSDRQAAFLEHFGFDFPADLELVTDLSEVDRLLAGPDIHYLNLQERMDVARPLPNAVVIIPGNTPGEPYSLEVKEHDPSFRIVLKGRLLQESLQAMRLPQWAGPVIGLHYRGAVGELTERSIRELVPDHDQRARAIEESYVETALAAAKAAGYANPSFLVTSDDPNFVAYVKQRLPNAFALATRLLDQEVMSYIQSQGHDIGVLIDAVNDLWCLSACDHLVHFRSGFSHFAILNSRKLGRGTTHYVHVPSFDEMLREADPGTAVVWARHVVRKADARRLQLDYWHESFARALDRAGMAEAAEAARRRARWHWEATDSPVADSPARLERPALMARGDYARLIEAQRRMIATLPDNPYLLSGYGHSLSTLLTLAGQYEHALAPARRAVALDPQDGYLRQQLGRLLLRTGALAAAEAEFRQAVACDPDVAGFYSDLIECLVRQGRPPGSGQSGPGAQDAA